jgi:LCP family protein required for cell wall assembly
VDPAESRRPATGRAMPDERQPRQTRRPPDDGRPTSRPHPARGDQATPPAGRARGPQPRPQPRPTPGGPDIPPRDRRHLRPRRWPRRILILVNLLTLAALIGSGAAYGYVKYRLGGIRTGSGAGLASATGSAENVLLIGNETRAGQTQVNFGSATRLSGTLSDVIMVLHLDPAKGQASILSIPRDLFVPMPAGSPVGPAQKIDAALNDGPQGPNNLARAITEDLGIPINHYVMVDFDGFLNTVDALGGIRLDFPERLYDLNAGLNIQQTGCQLLDGKQALALVRSRHLQYDAPGSGSDPAYWPHDPESDLSRIARDHVFVRALVQAAEKGALSNPLRTNAFLSAVLGQLTIDPQLKGQLLTLAAKYRHLNPAAAPEITLPVTQVLGSDGQGYSYDQNAMGDVEFPVQPADTDTISQWDAGVLAKPQTPSAVRVYNIVGSSNLASQTGDALRADGLPVTQELDGHIPADESETVVQYHPGQVAMGLSVFQHLTGAVVLQANGATPPGTVDVQAGTTFAVAPLAGAPAGSQTSSSSSSSSSSSGASSASSVPTPGGQAASSAQDPTTSYNPRPC